MESLGWYNWGCIGGIGRDDYSLFQLLLADFIAGRGSGLLPWNAHNPDNCFSILFTTDISFSLRQENCWNMIEAAPTPTYILFLTSWPPRYASPGLFATNSVSSSAASPAIPVFSQAHLHNSAWRPQLHHTTSLHAKPGPSLVPLTHHDPEQNPFLLFPLLCHLFLFNCWLAARSSISIFMSAFLDSQTFSCYFLQ